MIDVDGFEEYMINIKFQSHTNYVNYIKSLLKILSETDKYQDLSDEDKIIKFADENNSFKNKFDKIRIKYYEKSNTFSDLRSSARKYVSFLKSKTKENQMKTKNIILYGVPGVGKTHNYKRLISLIEQGESDKDIFDKIYENTPTAPTYSYYENALKEERVEFITFHQSYSYEEFIEGLHPQSDGSIEPEDGIFKQICRKARENLENSKINEEEFSTEKLLENFKDYVIEKLSNDEKTYLKNRITITISPRNSIILGGQIEKQSLSDEVILRDYVKFKNGNIKSYKDVKPSQISKSNHHGNARHYFNFYIKLREFERTQNQKELQKQRQNLKNFYLIIDEINRGNISKIFGEIITLIEENKRDSFSVTLPYSKEPFSIPSNLFIIASMNTADKSIAAIDIALRRRFTFLRLEPNADLVPEGTKRDFFKKANKYIEEKLGKDYLLGHAYFMNEYDLDFTKKYKIKPLLEEYFYAEEKSSDEILKEIEKVELKEQ